MIFTNFLLVFERKPNSFGFSKMVLRKLLWGFINFCMFKKLSPQFQLWELKND
jgi:hypothetical protein